MLLILVLLCVPMIEIALFIVLGDVLGLGLTLLIVAVTALVGGYTLRRQGLQTLDKLQTVAASDAPTTMMEGLLLAAAGLLLLTPGFFTDALGFALIIPPIRRAFAAQLASRAVVFATRTVRARAAANHQPFGAQNHRPDSSDAGQRRPNDAVHVSQVSKPTSGPQRSKVEDATVIDEESPPRSQ